MSNSVDQRIVQMQFDNAQFEEGVASTMESLKELDKKLEFKNGVKGMQDIDRAASQIDFSGMEGSVSNIERLFGSLGETASSVLMGLGGKIQNIAAEVVEGVSIQPLTDGLGEYTTKLNSIQTIQANTLGKPNSSMRDITDTLDELNDYADKTIYNFAEMTRNIGTFTAAGVGLQDSQVAIKGIANMAAASGASSYDASRAMYQLSQALAAGSLKLQDWNSVVNANMGGKLFQEALLRTSDALGTGGREAVKAAGSFRESLKDGWISQEVLTKTLRNFTLATSEMTEEEKKSAEAMLEKEGYSKKAIKTIFEQANVAQEAATKVKTFEQLIDTTREALGSGWATSWEYIIGDLDQAKDLWTPIADRLGDVIGAFSDARNDLLRVWSRGDEEKGWESGRQAIIDGVKELVAIADAVVKPITDAWNNVFTAMDPKDLIDLSVGFRDFAKNLHETFENSDEVKVALSVLQGIFTALFGAVKIVAGAIGGGLVLALKTVASVISVVFSAIGTVIKFVGGIISAATNAVGNGMDLFGKLADFLRHNTGIDKNLANIIESIGKVFTGLGQIVSGKAPEGLETLGRAIDAISNNLKRFGQTIGNFIGGKAEAFVKFLEKLGKKAPEMGAKAYEFLSAQLEKLKPLLEPVADGLGKLFGAFDKAADSFRGITTGATFGNFFHEIESAFSHVTDFADPAQLENLGNNIRIAFKNMFGSIGDQFKQFFHSFGANLNIEGSPLEAVANFFKSLLDSLGPIGDGIKAFSSGLFGGDPLGGVKAFIDSLRNAILGIDPSSLVDGVSGVSDIADAVGQTAEKVKGVVDLKSMLGNPFEALGTLLANLANGVGSGLDAFLSKLDLGKIREFISSLAAIGISAGMVVGLYNLTKGLNAIGEVAKNIGQISEHLEKMTNQFEKLTKAVKMRMYAEMVKTIAISIAIMVAALAAIAIIGPDKLWPAVPLLLVLTAVMTGIFVLFGALGAADKLDFSAITKVAFSMLELAAAIAILALAVTMFSNVTGNSWEGVIQIGILMGLMYAMSVGMDKLDGHKIGSLGSGMLKMAVSLIVMYAAIGLLASMDTGVLIKGGLAIAGIMLIVALMSRLAGSGSRSLSMKGGSSLAVSMLSLAAVILVCYEVVKQLSSMGDVSSGVEALENIATVIGIMAIVMTVVGAMGGGKGSVSTLLAISLAIGVLALAIGGLAMVAKAGGNIGAGMLVIVAGLAAIAGICFVLSSIEPILKQTAIAIVIITAALIGFVAVALALSAVPFNVIAAGCLAMIPPLVIFLGVVAALGAIGEFFGAGIVALGVGFALFGVAMIGVAAALLIGVAALSVFTSISGAFIPAFQQFTDALIKCFKTEDFVGSMIGMSVAMALLGVASLVLGVGLGILSLAIWAFGNVFPEAVSKVMASIMALANFFTTQRDIVANGITNMLEAGVQGIVGFVTRFFTGGQELVKSIAGGLTGSGDTIRTGVADLVTNLGTLLWEGITGLNGVLLELLGGLASGILEGIANLVTGPINWLNDKVYEFTGGMMGVAPQAKEGAEELATATAEGLASKNEELGEGAKAKIDEIGEHITNATPLAGEAASGMVNAISSPFEMFGNGEDVFQKMGLTPDIISGGFESVKGFFTEKGVEIPDDMAQSIADGASGTDFVGMLASNGDFDFTQLTTMFQTGASDSAQSFKGTLGEEMSPVEINNLVANAADIDVDSLSENFSAAAAAAAQAFTSSFGENIQIDGAGPMEKVAAAMQSASGSMAAAGKTLIDSANTGFASGASKMSTNAKTAARSAISAVTSEKGSASSGGYQVGYNMGAGLKNGLDSGSSYLSARAAAIVRNAIAAMKAAAAEKSPSRETIWISEMMMRGLMVGFNNLRSNVVDSAASVISDSLGAMSDISYVSALLDDIDDQPTIRPVLDLTDYEAGINRMRGLNASAPMNSAQWANRMGTSSVDSGYYNKSNNMVINLNYGAGTSAADMVNEMAMILQTKNLMEA